MGPLIRIRYGETVQRTRVTRTGETDTSAPPVPIEKVAFARVQNVIRDDEHRGRRSTIERNMWCPRGADIAFGDRITRTNGEAYSVISGAQGDVDHPLTGHNLGVKRYRVRSVQAPGG
ncbi:hypothetical protein [Mycobacteroides abscessus]|uniref:hypothetical protein n=1 Tax=Mycobacteroides abscessus TaxID=36809 RepID=UPI000C268118|nr:hypothetical protein [Mycobacteroides abscessus]